MTTIAFRDGALAADTGVNAGGSISFHRCKLRRIGDAIYGFCGAAQLQNVVFDYFEIPKGDKPKFDDELFVNVLKVNQDGVFMIERNLEPYPVNGDFYAIGSGSDLALGAMATGASAVRAIEIAIEFDDATCGTVDHLELLIGREPKELKGVK